MNFAIGSRVRLSPVGLEHCAQGLIRIFRDYGVDPRTAVGYVVSAASVPNSLYVHWDGCDLTHSSWFYRRELVEDGSVAGGGYL